MWELEQLRACNEVLGGRLGETVRRLEEAERRQSEECAAGGVDICFVAGGTSRIRRL